MYTVFGYSDDCINFRAEFDSFVKAVLFHQDRCKSGVSFIMRERPGTCRFVPSW